MTEKTTQYCPECNRRVEFNVSSEEQTATIKNEKYAFTAKVARCVFCGEELDVSKM